MDSVVQGLTETTLSTCRRALELVSQNENAKSWFGGPTIATETGTDKVRRVKKNLRLKTLKNIFQSYAAVV